MVLGLFGFRSTKHLFKVDEHFARDWVFNEVQVFLFDESEVREKGSNIGNTRLLVLDSV